MVNYLLILLNHSLYDTKGNSNSKDDVGTTTFVASYKPITLMRYIRKAIDNESIIIIHR